VARAVHFSLRQARKIAFVTFGLNVFDIVRFHLHRPRACALWFRQICIWHPGVAVFRTIRGYGERNVAKLQAV
jgi:hypothetical protein